MNVKMLKAALAGLVLSVSSFANAGIIYQHDDGTGESSLAIANASNIWLNSFQAVVGGETITDVSIAFGSNINLDLPNNGDPMTGYIWSDPTNDGNPLDAVVVSTFNSTIQDIHTDTFINFLLNAPITFNVGEWFYVGFQAQSFAVSRDTTTSNGQSWIFSDGSSTALDANNLASITTSGEIGALNFPGNFLIRAGSSTAVPEPSTLAIFALGIMGLASRRFKNKS